MTAPGDKPGGRTFSWTPIGIPKFLWRCSWLVFGAVFFVPFALFWCAWHGWKWGRARLRSLYLVARANKARRYMKKMEKELQEEIDRLKG